MFVAVLPVEYKVPVEGPDPVQVLPTYDQSEKYEVIDKDTVAHSLAESTRTCS